MKKALYRIILTSTLFLIPHFSYAATLYVSTTPPVGGSDCSSTALSCSLAQAVSSANDGDEIKMAAGIYTGTGTEVVKVSKNLAFQGALDGFTVIDGQNIRKGFQIDLNKLAVISNIVITNGKSAGAGIQNFGKLILKDSFVQNNHAGTALLEVGGAISNIGEALLNNVVIQDNTANSGAGIFNMKVGAFYPGKLTLLNSSIVNNTSHSEDTSTPSKGTALYNNGGDVFLGNVTISGNKTDGTNAGIYQYSGNTALNFVTIYNNLSDTSGTLSGSITSLGSGVYIMEGEFAIMASVIAGNKIINDVPNDCFTNGTNTLKSYNINLMGATDHCTIHNMTPGVSNLTGTVANPLDPKLRPLSTISLGLLFFQRSHSPMSGSPLIDKIPQGQCTLGLGSGAPALTIDQRGALRPYGSDNKCDLGSVEASPALVPLANDHHHFPDTKIGESGDAQKHELVLTNIGDIAMKVTDASFNNSNFKVDSSNCNSDVQPESHCTLTLIFDPQQAGDQNAVLTVKTTAPIFTQFTYSVDGKALVNPLLTNQERSTGANADSAGGCSMNPGFTLSFTSLCFFGLGFATMLVTRIHKK